MPVTRLNLPLLATLALLGACAITAPGLNSDMIRDSFGSYGVDILRSDETRRVSSLYSGSDDSKTTRTYAVVDFTGRSAALMAAEHRAIVSGSSIGTTFRDAGWVIRKQHLFIGELEIPASYGEIATLMRIELPRTLATHQYLFVISKGERSFSYATITEIHHPDYLSASQLRMTYGEIVFDDTNRDSIHEFIGQPATK